MSDQSRVVSDLNDVKLNGVSDQSRAASDFTYVKLTGESDLNDAKLNGVSDPSQVVPDLNDVKLTGVSDPTRVLPDLNDVKRTGVSDPSEVVPDLNNEKRTGVSDQLGRTGLVKCICTIAASFLFTCTLSFSTYTFGNINPYVTSYLRNKTTGADIDYTDTLWIYQTVILTTCFVMPVVGLIANRIHYKLYLMAGVLCNAASLFGTYQALQVSFALTVVTYGVLAGLSICLIYPTCLRLPVEWVPRKKGLISGTILMGYGAGTFVWTTFTTWYINRDNLQPDLTVGNDVFYTQAAVLDKVPECFLMLGIIITSIQMFGLLLLFKAPINNEITVTVDKPSESVTHHSDQYHRNSQDNEQSSKVRNIQGVTDYAHSSVHESAAGRTIQRDETEFEHSSEHESAKAGANNRQTVMQNDTKKEYPCANYDKQKAVTRSLLANEAKLESCIASNNGNYSRDNSSSVVALEGNENSGGAFGSTREGLDDRHTHHQQYSPLQVLKSRVFWTVWFMLAFSQVGFTFVISLWKAYGQTFVNNDHFLATVASVSSVFNAIGRPFAGYLCDRFGCRNVILFAQCSLAALVATFATCESGGQWMLLAWVCAMFLSMCAFFTMIITFCFVAFGSYHFNVNIGLIDLSGGVGSLTSTFIAPVAKDAFGWHGIFYCGFAGLFAGLLLNISLDIKPGSARSW